MTEDQKRQLLANNVAVLDLLELYGENISGNELYNAVIGGIPVANSAFDIVCDNITYYPSSFDISFPTKSITNINTSRSITVSGINPLIYSIMVASGTGISIKHKQLFYDYSTKECTLWRTAAYKVITCNNNSYTTSLTGILSDSLNTEIGRIKFTSYHFPNIFTE